MELREVSLDVATRSGSLHSAPSLSALEPHYTVAELSELWSFSPSTVRRLFRAEPGVIKINRKSSKHKKRDYISLRIPASIAQRVLLRMQGHT